MSGESNIETLLKTMSPKLREGSYVFLTFDDRASEKLRAKAMLSFHEEEGETLIMLKEEADENDLDYEAIWSLITLTVHSDLEAVGFLAAISNKLADAGVSVNVISAYYHDHLFVPTDKADLSMEVIRKISE